MNTETTWSNVRRLTKILLKQYRTMIYGILVLNTWFAVWTAWSEASRTLSDDVSPWQINVLDSSMVMVLFMAIVLVFGCSRILSKDEISMFPGTVMSRYYSVVLTGHIIVLAAVLSSVWMYLLQGAAMIVLSHIYEGFIPGSVYRIHYLLYGVARYSGVLLAISGVSILWFTLLERFHPQFVYGGAALCGVSVMVLFLFYRDGISGVVQKAFRLYSGEGYSFGMLMAALLLVWAGGILLSVFLAGSVKAWGRSDGKRTGISIVLLFFAFSALVATAVGTVVQHSDEDTFDLAEFGRSTDDHMETVVDVSVLPQKERANINDYGIVWKNSAASGDYYTGEAGYLTGMSCSASQAEQYGLDFDASKLDQNHVILFLCSQGLTWDGVDLGKRILKAFENPVTLVKEPYDEAQQAEDADGETEAVYYYQVEMPERPAMLAVNASYGSLGAFLPNTTFGHQGYRWSGDDWTNHIWQIVIYPDEWETDMGKIEGSQS